MSLLFTASTKQTLLTYRNEKRWGRDWLVVNGVPIVEGVLKGNFVPVDEFGAFVNDWNGVPLVIRHPSNPGGSAKSPNVNVPIVGTFYNAGIDKKSKKLTGEFWLDVSALEAFDEGKQIIENVKSGKQVEVSTGYYARRETVAGVYANVRYGGIHREIHPDHIAILPDEIGACSIRSGCGLNRNSTSLQACDCTNKRQGEKYPMFAVNSNTMYHMKADSPMSFDEISEKVKRAFAELTMPTQPEVSGWITDIYPDRVIVSADGKMYSVGYRMEGGMNTPAFDKRADWVEVQRRREYVEVPSQVQNTTGDLPAEAKKLYEKVYDAAIEDGDSKEVAAKKAWGACKKAGWEKDEDTGKWSKVNNASNDIAGIFMLAGFKRAIIAEKNKTNG